MADSTRARKVADRIKVVVAEALERRVKDPRLGFVTITEVRVTGDLQQASIFYTVLGEDADLAGTQAALESARGLLRREVGQALSIRLIPQLEFIADAVPAAAAEIEALLRETARRDAELREAAAGAQPAGDADPYKHPDADDEDR